MQELRQQAESQPRWGCGKLTDFLRNQRHSWNHKRIRRVYQDPRLHLKRKPKKRLPARIAQTLVVLAESNQTWSLDFMSDSLSEGRTFREDILDAYLSDDLEEVPIITQHWLEVGSIWLRSNSDGFTHQPLLDTILSTIT